MSNLLTYLWPWRNRVLTAGLYSVLNKLFDIAPELLIGMAVDVVVKQSDSFIASFGISSLEGQMATLSVLTLVIWGLESLFEFLHRTRWRQLAQDVQHEMRLSAFEHVQKLEMNWFEGRRKGELTTILSEDVNQVERFLNTGISDILQIVASTIMVAAVFFYVSPLIAIFAMLPIPIIAVGARFFQRRLEPHYRALREAAGVLGAHLSTALMGISVIKSYTSEAQINQVLAKYSAAYQAKNYNAIVLSSAFTPLIRMAILAGFLFTLVLGGLQTLDGQMEVGAYSALVYLTQRLLWPFTRLGETVDLYQRSMASANRVLDLLEQPVETDEGLQLSAADFKKGIVFEDIKFGYTDRDPTFEHLALSVNAGAYTGIVGTTGAGKSTLLKLLLRYYEPQQGEVIIGGTNIKEIGRSCLRQNIGLVSQDGVLLYGSVAENIAMGKVGATLEEIRSAAKVAEIDDFISELPDGYDTIVGDQGERFSGGQRQRISLARAILKDPPILLLDEATSAVDNETEAVIVRAFRNIAKGKTVVVIAHRLSTVRGADVVHVLSEGQVCESGSHEELVNKNGVYARLWALQTGTIVL